MTTYSLDVLLFLFGISLLFPVEAQRDVFFVPRGSKHTVMVNSADFGARSKAGPSEFPVMLVMLGKWLGLAESQFSPTGKTKTKTKKQQDSARQYMGGAFRKIQFMLTIDIPFSSKVCFTPLHFYKRPTLVPVFFNWKKSKEDFCFFWKKKMEN